MTSKLLNNKGWYKSRILVGKKINGGSLSIGYMIAYGGNTQSAAPIHAKDKIIYDGLGHLHQLTKK